MPTAAQIAKAERNGISKKEFLSNFEGELFVVVFVQNTSDSKSRPVLPLMTSDLTLESWLVQRLYRSRWNIETIYRAIKGRDSGMYINLYEGRSLNAEYNHLCICYMLYNIFAYEFICLHGKHTIGWISCNARIFSCPSGIVFRFQARGFSQEDAIDAYKQSLAYIVTEFYADFFKRHPEYLENVPLDQFPMVDADAIFDFLYLPNEFLDKTNKACLKLLKNKIKERRGSNDV